MTVPMTIPEDLNADQRALLDEVLPDWEALELARIFVPPYTRMRDGHLQHVSGYWREVPGKAEEDSFPWAKDFTGVWGEKPTPDEDWEPVIDEIRDQGVGNCYEAGVTLMMAEHELGLRNARYVQGSVVGSGGEVADIRFAHTWVEADGETIVSEGQPVGTVRYAIDFASGNSAIMEVGLYYHIGQVRDVHEYTHREMLEKLVETRMHGPYSQDLIDMENARIEEMGQ